MIEIVEKFLPALFSLDKKGKIRLIMICVKGNIDSSPTVIITSAGLLDGKLRETSKLINSGKNIGKVNETSSYEQAESEAISMWNSKVDEGHKSSKMLIDKGKELGIILKEPLVVPDAYKKLSIRYNTSKEWHELPMLAEPYRKSKGKLKTVLFAQPKLDGVRCLAKLDADGEVILLSRGGKFYKVAHLEAALKPLLTKYPRMILDGEIYKHGIALQLISGAVRKEMKDMFDNDAWLEYHIYDVAANVEQHHRINKLASRLLEYNLDNNIVSGPLKMVETTRLEQEDAQRIKGLHDVYIDQGYEGLILRQYHEPYMFGFRDRALIKVKEFKDEEFLIIGCKVNDTLDIGTSFVFKLQNNTDSQTFDARPTGTEAMKEFWYHNPSSWKDQYATVRFQERSLGGLPIQAHVRADKTDCLIMTAIRNYE
jgi:ATP-dependent DNA ligase